MGSRYFSMEKTKETAIINIYGDITSYPWSESDVSSYNLSKQLEELQGVENIDVYINSYGGEVAEGLAIYNALKRHKAKVTTHCDGFACSIASVIFMAGDERVMPEASMLMIHNAWTIAAGNAKELRKQADDLEKISQASVEAYKACSTLSEEEIKELMDNETWILPEEALEYGFATSVKKTEKEKANQNALQILMKIVKAHQEEKEETSEENPEGEKTDDESTEGETPDDETTDDEPKDEEKTEEETVSESENGSEDDEITAQKWSGFFNAILKM